MDEKNKKKPLLSYEQVMQIINERIEQDEPIACDERIERIEKAASQIERKQKAGRSGMKRFFLCLKYCPKNLYHCMRGCLKKRSKNK